MKTEPTNPLSLDNLHDIVEVEPVSLWWPLAPGWWALLGLLAIVLFLVLWRVWRNRKRNAYRRYALKELEELASPGALPVLLKRVALVAYPREKVAPLSGQRWIEFLNKEVPGCFDAACAACLLELDYQPTRLNGVGTETLMAAIRRWTLEHPPAEEPG